MPGELEAQLGTVGKREIPLEVRFELQATLDSVRYVDVTVIDLTALLDRSTGPRFFLSATATRGLPLSEDDGEWE